MISYLEMCSKSSSVRLLGGAFLMLRPLELPLEAAAEMSGVPPLWPWPLAFEHWTTVQPRRMRERKRVALTTPMKTGSVTMSRNLLNRPKAAGSIDWSAARRSEHWRGLEEFITS